MADKRLNTLDNQPTRLTDLLIAVDKASGFTEVKKITSALLSPLISEESSKASITNSERGAYEMRVNDSVGNEYRIVIDDLLAPDATAWTTPSLNSNWSQLSGNNLKYRKNIIGQLELKGAVIVGAAQATGPFTLPANFRPAEARTISISRQDPSGNLLLEVYVTVNTDGTFDYAKPGGTPQNWPDGYIHFDSIIILD